MSKSLLCYVVFISLLKFNFQNIDCSTSILFHQPIVYPLDRDADLNQVQVIESRGFKSETHYVTTDDGYILTMYRIISGNSTSGRPFILQHGLQSSSLDFTITAPDVGDENSVIYFKNQVVGKNLGFTMSKFGYDVWLPNSTGNVFSKNHTYLNPMLPEYWAFTHDELSLFDLPAVINFVLSATNRRTVGYIGHSLGPKIMFCLLAERPEFEKIIKPFIALAPAVRLSHLPIHLKVTLSALLPIAEAAKYTSVPLFENPPGVINAVNKNLCRIRLVKESICSTAVFLGSGFDFRELNQSRLHVIASHFPAGSSIWNAVHYLQNFKSHSLAKFDYGFKKNLIRYNSPFPPMYNLKKIKMRDICLISSVNDYLATPKDVQWLRDQLPDSLLCDHIIPIAKWNHIDYVYGLETEKYVNIVVLRNIAAYDNFT